MRVLIACEFSGIVREAFARRGHDAWSCDLLPTEIPGQHIQGDVREVLDDGWDLMIAHPPCTRLCTRGEYWTRKRGLYQEKADAIRFFLNLYNAPIQRIAVENPMGIMSTILRQPDQYINPFEHGHPERKRTGLWLKNLPRLITSSWVRPEEPTYIDKSGQKRYFVDRLSSTVDRAQIRSRTFTGIAEAMAEQWGNTDTFPIAVPLPLFAAVSR